MQNSKEKIISLIEDFNIGNKERAIKKFDVLLKHTKRTHDLLSIYADMLNANHNIDDAINIFKEILETKPENKEVLKKIYTCYLKIEKFKEAEIFLDKLLIFDNESYEVLRDKAFLLYLKNEYKKSNEYIHEALNINDNEVFGLNIIGLLKIQNKEIYEALQSFNKAIKINPDYADSYNNAGKCYIDLEDLQSAYKHFKKAYRLNKNSDLAILNIANILSLKDKNKFAIKFYQKAKNLNRKNKLIDENIAISQLRSKNTKWIEDYYKNTKSSLISEDFLLGYSYFLLSQKKFKDGFKLFDSRLKQKAFIIKNKYHHNLSKVLTFPSTLNKESKILIVKEQGVGDEILLSSMYVNLIKECKNIKIECDQRLKEIFKKSFKRDVFYTFGHFSSSLEKLNDFENILYAGSLTKYYRNELKDFDVIPFLTTNSKTDNKILNNIKEFKNSKKIGISWKSVINIYGKLKSLQINDFKCLFNSSRTIFNLQYGDTIKDINKIRNEGFEVFNFNAIDLFNDFESLMSILKNIDVFVTVSNSTAHFAGALGVPTILICPKKSSTYYYWDYSDGKTPWYTNVRIVTIDGSIERTMNKVNKLIDLI